MRSDSGFTLVELLTALAVSAILLGTAVWQGQRAIEAHRASSAARRFVMDVRQASAIAARRNRPVQIVVDNGGPASCNPSYKIVALGIVGEPDAVVDTVCINAEYPGVRLANPVGSAPSCTIDSGAGALPSCSLCTGSKTLTFYPSSEAATAGAVGDTIAFTPRGSAPSSTVAVGVRNFTGKARVYLASGGGWTCP